MLKRVYESVVEYDLSSSEDVVVIGKAKVVMRTGLAISIPSRGCARIALPSTLAANGILELEQELQKPIIMMSRVSFCLIMRTTYSMSDRGTGVCRLGHCQIDLIKHRRSSVEEV